MFVGKKTRVWQRERGEFGEESGEFREGAGEVA
jgi:hypothetical protein